MADHSENALRAVIKSLRDVVGPSVAADDPLAQEQLGLSLLHLEFLATRLPRLHTRAVFELKHHLRMAHAVVDRLGESRAADALVASVEDADHLVSNPTARTDTLGKAADRISADITAVLRADLETSVVADIERTIVDISAERIAFERAWYLPTGFDPNPESVLSLDDASTARA
ncbi:hypothetical protein ACFVKB_08255 [Rhodococcus sp. NPDC127530]|uniref:hypothetical protein n=1 Tax=unclassified Rhodococcus (in: high G+C Gram-positive bacteria) TaxID=192944 RepID=UPI00363BA212